jgi:dihydroflavonol-4-reductase
VSHLKTIYIVTGAAGHLGSHVVRQLLASGRQVRALVLPNESCMPYLESSFADNFKQIVGNVLYPSSLLPLFEGDIETEFVVIHCAGIVSISKKFDKKIYNVNVVGTKNIVDICVQNKVKRLVYVSSVHALPLMPDNQVMKEIDFFDENKVEGCYAKTKAIASQTVLNAVKNGLDAVIVHPSGIIGPDGLTTGNMTQLVSLYLRGRFSTAVRGGYDFVDVRDVAKGIVSAADNGKIGQCYILSNRYVSVKELFDLLSQISGQKRIKTYLPIWFAKSFAPLSEVYCKIFKKTPLFTSYSMDTLSKNSLFTHEKADRELFYTTRPLKDTLADTVNWFRKNSNIPPKRISKTRRKPIKVQS